MSTVLHIDYSKFYQKVLNNLFTDDDIRYIGVSDEIEAFDVLGNESVEVILTSLGLTSSISSFLSRLNENPRWRKIPVFVITSNDSNEEREMLFKLGIIDIMHKDSTPEDISSYIARYIRRHDNIVENADISIAVLDDSNFERKVIEMFLESYAFNSADYFSDGYSLLKTKKKYDIYIMDYVLEDSTAEDFIWRIKEKNESAVILVVSVLNNYRIISHCLAEGADDFILKPFDRDVLHARMKAHIRNIRLLRKVHRMAITDGLTELYNHQHFLQLLEESIKNSVNTKSHFSVIMIDLDDFKSINDTYGHPVGDIVLRKISSVIKNSLSKNEYAGRFGGEEFIIALPDADEQKACRIAENIRMHIENIKWNFDGLKTTVSGGVVEYHSGKGEGLVKSVDLLLYKAKNEGKNRMVSPT